MKQLCLAIGLLIGISAAASAGASAATRARSPIGDWLTGRGGAVVRIAPCPDGAGLCGHIVGLMLDHGTKMPSDFQGRPQCGFELIQPSAARGSAWHGGIVDPRNGNRYDAEFHVTNSGELALRGYIGLPLFGQTQHWLRYDGQIPNSCRIGQAQLAQSGTSTTQRND